MLKQANLKENYHNYSEDYEESTTFIASKNKLFSQNVGDNKGKIGALLVIIMLLLSLAIFKIKLEQRSIQDEEFSKTTEIENQPQNFEKKEIFQALRRIPRNKRGLYLEENLQAKKKEYNAFRFKNWKEDGRVFQAEEKYNIHKYNLNTKTQEHSICIPIISGQSNSSSIKKMLESVFRQKYDNYHIFVYGRNEDQLNIKNTNKVKFITGDMGQLEECKNFDVVLMMKEGELIGRFVLQRINTVYQIGDVDMTYSNVLGFSNSQKMPISRSSSSGNQNENFVENLFSEFLWSFRTRHLGEVSVYLKKVEKVCKSQEEFMDAQAIYGLEKLGLQKIQHIKEFDLYIEEEREVGKKQSCVELFLEKELKSINFQFVKASQKLKQKNLFNFQITEAVDLIEELKKIPLLNLQQEDIDNTQAHGKTFFAYRLSLDPDNPKYKAAEYQYYDKKYKIGSYERELPFCVVSVGRNNNNRIEKYLGSLARQNYSNYHVVYVDDASDDESVQKTEELIFLEYPELKEKVTIVQNPSRLFSLASQHKAISQYCQQDDIIIDMSPKSQLIGKQTFKLLNSLYSGENNIWFLYSNSIILDEARKQIQRGNSQHIKSDSFQSHTLRFQPLTIDGLKTFNRQAYMKIDQNDFKDENGHYQETQEAVAYFPLVELSGPDRMMFVDEYSIKLHKKTSTKDIKSDFMLNKQPYEILLSFESQPQKVPLEIENEKMKHKIEDENERELEKDPKKVIRKNEKEEEKLKQIIERNNKKFICSSNQTVKKGILSEEFRTNHTEECRQIQQYYFDTRYQIHLSRKKQSPLYIVAEIDQPEENFKPFYYSLVRQQYNRLNLIFLYSHNYEEKFLKYFMMKYYPILLQKTLFLSKTSYPSLQSIVADFCQEGIVMQLSMKSQLTGSQSLMLVNSIFRNNKEIQAVAAPSIMQINQNKIQVKEIDENVFNTKEKYMNYYNTHKGLFAVKIKKETQDFTLQRQSIQIIQNALTYFKYKTQKKEKVAVQTDNNIQYEILQLKNSFKIPRQLKPSHYFKIKPTFNSYLATRWWKEPEKLSYIEMQKYLYEKNYQLGAYLYEEPLCIVATGRSPQLMQTYQFFLQSLYRQNYTNYTVVLGHLNFDELVNIKIKQFIEMKGKGFSKKFRAIEQYSDLSQQNPFLLKATLANNYCKDGQLVVELDATDQLIGVYALSLINTVFQANPEVWFIMANSLYEDPEENEDSKILPSTLKEFKHPWEIFSYDKIKIMKKSLLNNIAFHLSSKTSENEAYLRLLQQSGSRFLFLNQFLSFDHETDFYCSLNAEQKYNLYHTLTVPYQPLKYETDLSSERASMNLWKQGLPYQNFHSLFYFKKLYESEEIKKRQEEIKQENYKALMEEVMKPTHVNGYKRKQSLYLFYRLKEEPYNEKYLKAEYMYLNREYKIENYPKELPICVVSAGRNLKEKNDSYKLYIDSMARMNYTNFRLIYTDDMSDDGTAEAMRKYADENYPLLSKKLKIVENEERVYSLANKNSMIRYHCNNENDIIYDIDADDYLLGRQFFKVLNAVYQQNDYWFVYANYCWFKEKELMRGQSKPLPEDLMADYSYRRKAFVTIGPRSFLRKLYMKIDENDFKYEDGRFYVEIGDGFIYAALAELAGVNHSHFIPEPPYFYDTYNIMGNLEVKRQNAYIMKRKVPFKTLESLDSQVEKVPDYKLTSRMEKDIAKTLRWYQELIHERDEKLKKESKSMEEKTALVKTEI